MSTFFNTVHITNFKSLKDVTLSDCKRINLLIGKPNVGKSNILEAIGLFSFPYTRYFFNENKKLSQLVRLENVEELFFDGNIEDIVSIKIDMNLSCTIEYNKYSYQHKDNYALFTIGGKGYGFELLNHEDTIRFIEARVTNDLKIGVLELKNLGLPVNTYPDKILSRIKYYKFTHNIFHEWEGNQTNFYDYLIPPFGINLIEIIRNNKELKKDLIGIFAEYNLKLLFDKGTGLLRIVKDTKDGEIFSIPYNSIADTLQRIVFFKTAIASNKDSIILFEEPEAHCFPPYIRHITQEIIESESNQFFIATHSPYVLNDFLEYQRDDVAIFMANFKDGQTVIKRLTDNQVNDVYEYGIDLFFNSELFTDEI